MNVIRRTYLYTPLIGSIQLQHPALHQIVPTKGYQPGHMLHVIGHLIQVQLDQNIAELFSSYR